MPTPTETLWRVNNEYFKRLALALKYLTLLEQLVVSQQQDYPPDTLDALRYVGQVIEQLDDEHRQWRYTYYYASPESKRMVQRPSEVHRALAHFSRMHTRHAQRLAELHGVLQEIERPAPQVTRLPHGDLWEMTQLAVYDLIDFQGYLEDLAPV